MFNCLLLCRVSTDAVTVLGGSRLVSWGEIELAVFRLAGWIELGAEKAGVETALSQASNDVGR